MTAPRGVLLLSVALGVAGAFLRVHRYGEMLVFGDEIHALVTATQHDAAWIFRHFTQADSSIPLALWDRALLALGALDERTLRLPGVLAGVALLGLLIRGLPRRVGPATGLAVLALLALSPWAIFVAREARPYAIVMTLFSAGLWAVQRCLADGRPRLVLAALLFALAAFFHPVTLVSTGVVALALVVGAARGRLEPAVTRSLPAAGATLAGTLLLLLGPSFASLLASVAGKSAAGSAGFSTASYALGLALAAPGAVPAWLGAVPIAAGAWRLRAHGLGTVGVAMIAVQVVLLALLQPELAETPWVYLRYFAHLVPLAVLLAASGIALAMPARLRGTPAVALVAAGALAYAAWNAEAGRYRFLTGSTNPHPSVFWVEGEDVTQAALPGPLAFYQSLANDPSDGAILEVPLQLMLPVHSLYERLHGRSVYAGALAEGRGQAVFSAAGTRFERVLPAWGPLPADVSWVVVHKRPRRETRFWFERLTRRPTEAVLLAPLGMLYDAEGLALQFPAALPALPDYGPVVYEDRWIRVHRVDARR